MFADTPLQKLESHGFLLWFEAPDTVHVNPIKRVTDEIYLFVDQNKAAIIAELIKRESDTIQPGLFAQESYAGLPGSEWASDTSQAAAESIAQITAAMRRYVYQGVAHAELDGSTCDEAEIVLLMSHQTCSARFTELHGPDYRMIVRVGMRPTRSGRNAGVYITTKLARVWVDTYGGIDPKKHLPRRNI